VAEEAEFVEVELGSAVVPVVVDGVSEDWLVEV